MTVASEFQKGVVPMCNGSLILMERREQGLSTFEVLTLMLMSGSFVTGLISLMLMLIEQKNDRR